MLTNFNKGKRATALVNANFVQLVLKNNYGNRHQRTE